MADTIYFYAVGIVDGARIALSPVVEILALDGEAGPEPEPLPNTQDTDPHRYWRLMPTFNYGATNYTGISRVQLRDAEGVSQEVSGGSIIFSSQFNDSTFAAANTLDGSTTTRWLTTADLAYPSFVGYDFGEGNARNVVEVEIYPDNGTNRTYDVRAFRLQHSDDGVVWTDRIIASAVDAWTRNVPKVFNLTTNPFPVQIEKKKHWRLYVTAVAAGATSVAIPRLDLNLAVDGFTMADFGTASASSSNSGSTEPGEAFDTFNTSSWQSLIGAAFPQWINFELDSPLDLAEVRITATSDPLTAPRDFEIQSSNDGVTYVTEASFSGVTWTANEAKRFAI